MNILKQKRFGLILRVFATKPELVEKRAEEVIDTVRRALNASVFLGAGNTAPITGFLSRIDVLVSADSRYEDSDCGETAAYLRKCLADVSSMLESPAIKTTVHVSEVTRGDIYCGILNYGIAHQLRDRIDYTFILSSGVRSYFTAETLTTMLKAAEDGAKVVGVEIAELSESIRAGRIANTFALWHNESLVSVGGFDLRAAKPPKGDRLTRYLRGWNEEVGEVYYHVAGVEEIIPLIRLVHTYGPCIAPIAPQGEGAPQWVAPTDTEGLARERKKLATKYVRQAAIAVIEGVDLSYLEGGVLEAYRH